MSANLEWQVEEGGVRFRMSRNGNAVPFDQWALERAVTMVGAPVRVSPLLRLHEAETASRDDATTLVVPNTEIARMSPAELEALGLPPRATFAMQIQREGILTDPGFRVSLQFIHPEGWPVYGMQMHGVFVRAGTKEYVLGDTQFALLTSVEFLNAIPPDEVDRRFAAWGAIRDLLPANLALDDYLDSIRVVSADAFTLQPSVNTNGECDFEPVPVCVTRERDQDEFEGFGLGYEAVLPEARQRSFGRYFRTRDDVAALHPVGHGWFFAPSAKLRKALVVVREMQERPAEQRNGFIRNPRVFLRERLAAELGEEELEALFCDVGYSDRVKEVGLLRPPERGLGSSGVEWFPEDSPWTTSLSEAGDADETDKEDETAEDLERRDRIGLVIKDNIEEVEYQRTRDEVVFAAVGEKPDRLKSGLYEHQEEALCWLQEQWTSGNPGALLADDMGLGKTLVAMAFAAWLKQRWEAMGERKPILVVAPTAILKNWVDEHALHLCAPGIGELTEAFGSGLRDLRIRKYKPTAELSSGLPMLNVAQLASSDWVITNYETLRDYQHSFGRVSWGAFILDEVQRAKNPEAGVTQAVKAMNSSFTLAMTGTPVENRLGDLWCIIDTLHPGLLGSLREFSLKYEGNDPAVDSAPQEELKRILMEKRPSPLMLRRLKKDRLQGLPEKRDRVIQKTMPPAQAEAYARVVGKLRGERAISVLESLQKLRKVCVHPEMENHVDDNEYVGKSARLIAAFEMLDEISKREERALIFVDFLVMQAILCEIIQRRYALKSPPLIINGGISTEKRKLRVDRFQKGRGFDVMILSPRAGGVGLTLTAANHVIHVNRWWNPAVEDQCSDRVFRIGQELPVHVYYPLAIHAGLPDRCFDINLHRLLEKKRALSHSVLAPPGMTEREAASLLNDSIRECELSDSTVG